MNAIKGELIINYTICWYDDNLGSAEKFFDKNDNNDIINKNSVLNIESWVNIELPQNENQSLEQLQKTKTKKEYNFSNIFGVIPQKKEEKKSKKKGEKEED